MMRQDAMALDTMPPRGNMSQGPSPRYKTAGHNATKQRGKTCLDGTAWQDYFKLNETRWQDEMVSDYSKLNETRWRDALVQNKSKQ
jgi:hypothetical protein